MAFRALKAPLCRYCGGAIAKRTNAVFVKDRPYDERYDKSLSSNARTINVEKLPQTIAECRKLTNLHVVAVTRERRRKSDDSRMTDYDVLVDAGIDRFSEWDGESYEDEFFCNGGHARRFAYVFAKAGRTTKAYEEARARLLQKEDAA